MKIEVLFGFLDSRIYGGHKSKEEDAETLFPLPPLFEAEASCIMRKH